MFFLLHEFTRAKLFKGSAKSMKLNEQLRVYFDSIRLWLEGQTLGLIRWVHFRYYLKIYLT